MSFWSRITFFVRGNEMAMAPDSPERSVKAALRVLGGLYAIAMVVVLAVWLTSLITSLNHAKVSGLEPTAWQVLALVFSPLWGITISLALLWWMGRTWEQWSDDGPRALVRSRVIAIITLAFNGFGLILSIATWSRLIFGSADDEIIWSSVWVMAVADLLNLLTIAAAIALLVFAVKVASSEASPSAQAA